MDEYVLTPFGRLVQRAIAAVEDRKRKEGNGVPRIPLGEVGLVLNRCLKEGITMTLADGQKIHVRVVGFRPGPSVKLGIMAPKEVAVHRDEIQQRIDAGEVRV